jgi:hypothetical protein
MAVAIPPKRPSAPPRGRLGSTRDPVMDVIVLACVLMFMLMAAGFGLLILQQSFN